VQSGKKIGGTEKEINEKGENKIKRECLINSTKA